MESGIHSLKRWWTQKYRLPPAHDLFQSQSIPELLQEQYGDLIEEKAGLEHSLDSDSGTAQFRATVMGRLRAIRKALGELEDWDEDDLTDFWEDEVAAGRTPDLDMMPKDIPDGWRKERRR